MDAACGRSDNPSRWGRIILVDTRALGASGIAVSALGLGCNNFGGRIGFDASRRVIHAALDRGVTFFDTADVYGERGGSEEILGRVLGPRRRDVVIATKFGMAMGDGLTGASSRYVARALDASLKRLGTDYVDLYQIHFPDPATPIEETLSALDVLVRQGKARAIGCSNFAIFQLVDASRTSNSNDLARFVSCQNEYSLLNREAEQEILPIVAAYGMAFLPYYPLAGGFLTGKYRRGAAMPDGARLTGNPRQAERTMTERNWRLVEKLSAFAAARGHTLGELAIAWLLSRPVIASVIAGATTLEQIEANVRAATWTLSSEDVDAIDDLY
jgi:aryl-alcohol dehydrogenase-like predicted oxidoreductase